MLGRRALVMVVRRMEGAPGAHAQLQVSGVRREPPAGPAPSRACSVTRPGCPRSVTASASTSPLPCVLP